MQHFSTARLAALLAWRFPERCAHQGIPDCFASLIDRAARFINFQVGDNNAPQQDVNYNRNSDELPAFAHVDSPLTDLVPAQAKYLSFANNATEKMRRQAVG
ncbi:MULTISPECIES: hypothetical protein [unclassified Pseudomonas]|uniref:hypothetical protein n=1 Tax=unclassified Pseudomonas TaxID=196821 RepID=UPI0021C8F2D0|nr:MULTISPECIES: hypothetical protein [unclassified Pseudomonas]MCU1730956.1 hypothetical protein [Pseudomonas sp. 20P_3.2_Bac4]MCU1742925.1 hypothetical protein [Pseudomonas sp. 20P_3.2_Bac5]